MSVPPLQENGNGEPETIQPFDDPGHTGDLLQAPPDDGEGIDGEVEKMEIGDPLYAEVKEQDRWLPIANVARIMKIALPDNAKIAKEAKECMQECVSEYISFITSEAAEKCQQEKRKTVNGEDILFAMTSLGFENMGEALKIYLARYRSTHVPKGGDSKKEDDPQILDSVDADNGHVYQEQAVIAASRGNAKTEPTYHGLETVDDHAVAGAVDPEFDLTHTASLPPDENLPTHNTTIEGSSYNAYDV